MQWGFLCLGVHLLLSKINPSKLYGAASFFRYHEQLLFQANITSFVNAPTGKLGLDSWNWSIGVSTTPLLFPPLSSPSSPTGGAGYTCIGVAPFVRRGSCPARRKTFSSGTFSPTINPPSLPPTILPIHTPTPSLRAPLTPPLPTPLLHAIHALAHANAYNHRAPPNLPFPSSPEVYFTTPSQPPPPPQHLLPPSFFASHDAPNNIFQHTVNAARHADADLRTAATHLSFTIPFSFPYHNSHYTYYHNPPYSKSIPLINSRRHDFSSRFYPTDPPTPFILPTTPPFTPSSILVCVPFSPPNCVITQPLTQPSPPPPPLSPLDHPSPALHSLTCASSALSSCIYTPPYTLSPYNTFIIRNLVQTTSACLQTTSAVFLHAHLQMFALLLHDCLQNVFALLLHVCLQNVYVAHLMYALMFLAVIAHMYAMYAHAAARRY